VTNRVGQGRAARVAVAGGRARWKTGGPTSNQTKIQFFLKIIFIIEHIKKTRIFLKKKKEKRK
jgi:hypothetical protein